MKLFSNFREGFGGAGFWGGGFIPRLLSEKYAKLKKSDVAWTTFTVKSAHGVDLEITKLKNECCLNEL